MAGAYVNGYQGTPDRAVRQRLSEGGRDGQALRAQRRRGQRTGVSSNVSDTDLRDYYTAQFQSLIETRTSRA